MLFWPGVMRTGPYLNFRCCTPGCSGAFTTIAFASLLGMAEVEVSSFVDDDFVVVDGAGLAALPDDVFESSPLLPHAAIITTARTGATIAMTHMRHGRRVPAAFLSFPCTTLPFGWIPTARAQVARSVRRPPYPHRSRWRPGGWAVVRPAVTDGNRARRRVPVGPRRAGLSRRRCA